MMLSLDHVGEDGGQVNVRSDQGFRIVRLTKLR